MLVYWPCCPLNVAHATPIDLSTFVPWAGRVTALDHPPPAWMYVELVVSFSVEERFRKTPWRNTQGTGTSLAVRPIYSPEHLPAMPWIPEASTVHLTDRPSEATFSLVYQANRLVTAD